MKYKWIQNYVMTIAVILIILIISPGQAGLVFGETIDSENNTYRTQTVSTSNTENNSSPQPTPDETGNTQDITVSQTEAAATETITSSSLSTASMSSASSDGAGNGVSSQQTDATGGFVHQYPISLPPGTAGYTPSLALVYNSGAPNGMLGLGWTLTGLSAIYRDPSYEISFDDTRDHFCLDGERLIYSDPNTGGDGYYHTARESFMRIEFKNPNTASSYWIVSLKNGQKLYFGYQASEHTTTTDGRIEAIGQNGKPRLWSLSKAATIQGNYYTVEYYEDSVHGDFYPWKITYTKNANHPLTQYRTVEFSYEIRTDHGVQYIPSKVDMLRRLKWITIKIGGNLLKKIRLDYDYSGTTGRSRLTEIQEYGSDGNVPPTPWVDVGYIASGSALPKITFTCQSGEKGWTAYPTNGYAISSGYSDNNKFPVLSGDWNGDGRTDFGRVGVSQVYMKTSTGSSWMAYPSMSTDLTPSNGFSDNSKYPVLIGDWNGDGKTDIGRVGNRKVYFTNSTGNGWEPYSSIFETLTPENGFTDSNKYPVLIGDWNGDGKTDIGRVGYSKVYFFSSTGEGWEPYPSLTNSLTLENGFTDSNKYPVLIGDWNGDGKTDIGRVGASKVYFYLSTGEGWESYSSIHEALTPVNGYTDNNKFPVLIGDWNGDGKFDVGRVGASKVYFYCSTGTGWESYSSINDSLTPENGFTDGNKYPVLTGDWNGDGRTDIGRVGYNSIYLYRSTGGGWVSYGLVNAYSVAQGFLDGNQYPLLFGDWNGDGVIDFGRAGESQIYYRTNQIKPEVMITIQNNRGGTVGINYLPASQVPGAIDPGGKSYPNIADSSPRQLVTKITLHDGPGQTVSASYQYSNAMFHQGFPHERASLGFAWVKKIDDNTGSAVITSYRQDDLDLKGMVDKQTVLGSNSLKYAETQYSYGKRTIADNIKFIYVTDEYLYNHNGEPENPIEYHTAYTSYDAWGNLEEVVNYGDTDIATDDIRRTTEYINDTTDFVTLTSVTREYAYNLNGQNGLAAESRFFYTNYLLTRKELENGDRDVILTFGHDVYGNIISATDGNNNNNIVIYDTLYQTAPRYQTNALNQTTETVYDSLMRPIRQIDPNGAIRETTYDVFSRVTTTILPGDDGANPTIRSAYPDEFIDSQTGNPLFPARRKVEKKEADGGYLEAYVYSDGLGRKIQEKSEAKNGWITIDHFYDNSGREWKTSVPYLTATAAYTAPDPTVKYTWTEFDPISRVSVIHYPDGTTIQKIYHKKEVLTIDAKGHTTSKKIIGNTEYAVAYQGVYPAHIEYTRTTTQKAYDGIRITDGLNNVIEVRVDLLGSKTSYSDPDMGTWSYTYDANGNLTGQTDAKSQTITMSYDGLNRLRQENYPDGAKTCYYYDESGHGAALGRLTRVVYPGGSESYVYDLRGRVTFSTQTIDGESRTQSMTYDAMDRLVTQVYPDGEVVNFTYDESGNLKTLAGNSSYVTGIDYAPYGKITRMEYGNGTEAIYDYYDTAGEYDPSAGTYYSYLLKQIRVTKAGTDILNLNYEYDQAGNITWKRDILNGAYTENYAYDDLYRLTGSSSTVYGNKVYSYDTVNNILAKDGRNYLYGSARPHAVTDDGRYQYTYDANGNMLTRSDGRTFVWDYKNRLSSVSDGGSFSYAAGERRIKKVEGGVTTYYFFANYEEEYQGGSLARTVKYYFAAGQRVAERSSVEGLRYFHQDHLSSSVAVTDETGVKVYRAVYAPFGSLAAAEGVGNYKYQFTGQEKDGNGLYYYGARYYDPELGRFISPDTALDGLNRYTYCGNSPIMYNDPTGHFLTFSIGPNGFSIGINFAPIGIPWGFGINVSWANGGSVGGYVEYGYRTLCFDGGAVRVGADYNFGSGSWTGYATASAGINVGSFGIGVSVTSNSGGLSYGLDFNRGIYTAGCSFGDFGWDIHFGLANNGFQTGGWELGASISWGNSGFGWGINGRYTQNPFAKYNEIEGMTIVRKEPFSDPDDPFGHYWIEIDLDMDGTVDESYGFWPECQVSDDPIGVLTNKYKGEVNGITGFRGTETRDPEVNIRSVYTTTFKVYGVNSRHYYINSIRSYSSSFSGQYGIPFGNSCQTFQKSWLFMNGLKIR